MQSMSAARFLQNKIFFIFKGSRLNVRLYLIDQLLTNWMMYLIILTSLLVFCSYARIYNVGMNCGVCEATTGCLNNICLKFTGDITS